MDTHASRLAVTRPDVFHSFKDNCVPLHPKVRAAQDAAHNEHARVGWFDSYGNDPYTCRAVEILKSNLAASDVTFVSTGTAAISLVSGLLRRTQKVFVLAGGHADTLEAGAIATSGAQPILLRPNSLGKLSLEELSDRLRDLHAIEAIGKSHQGLPGGALIIEQPSMYGFSYTAEELSNLAMLCREEKLLFIIDGARAGISCAELGLTPNAFTTHSDFFLTGFSKLGGPQVSVITAHSRAAEALWPELLASKKQGGHLGERPFETSAQVIAIVEDDLWLKNATIALEAAQRLRLRLDNPSFQELGGRLTGGGNLVFAKLPEAFDEARVKATLWRAPDLWRFATHYRTTDAAIAAVATPSEHLYERMVLGAHPT